jgi:hypothetical protein
LNGIQKYQQGGFLKGEDNTGAGHLRPLATDDPARELHVFEEIVAAFAGNSRCKDVAVRDPRRRRTTHEARTALLVSVAHRQCVQVPPQSRPDKPSQAHCKMHQPSAENRAPAFFSHSHHFPAR